jgi:hypothetical protein
VKQALIDSLFYLTACIISGVIVIFLFIGFPILIIDWLLSAQLTNAEAFLTFSLKNPLKNMLGLLTTGKLGIALWGVKIIVILLTFF